MSIHNVPISTNTTAGEAFILALVDAGNAPEDARTLYENAQVRLILRYLDESNVEHVIRMEAGDVLSQNPVIGTQTTIPVEIDPETFRTLTEEELQTVRPHIPPALRDLFRPSDPSTAQDESARLAERHVLESLLAMTEEEQAVLRERAGNEPTVLSPEDFLDYLRAFERSLFDAMLDLVQRASDIPDTHADTPAGHAMIDEIERALQAKLGLRFQESALRSHLARLRRASQFGHAQAAEDSSAAIDAYVADPSEANREVYLDAFEEEAVYVAMAALDNAAQVVANCRDAEILAELFAALGSSRPLYREYFELQQNLNNMNEPLPGGVRENTRTESDYSEVDLARTRTEDEARRTLAGYEVIAQDRDDFYLNLAATNSVEDLRQVLDGGRLSDIESAIVEMRQRLAESPEVIWQLDNLREATVRQAGHGDGTVPDMLVDDEARRVARERQLEDLGLAGAALALGVVALFTTGPVGAVATVGAVGLSTADAARTIDSYMLENAAHDVDLLKSDPWIGWAVLSVAGLGFDGLDLIRLVGHGTQIAAAARQVTRAVQATDTSGEALEVFRAAVRSDTSLSASQQNALIEAAEARLASGAEDAMGLANPRMPDFDDLPTNPSDRVPALDGDPEIRSNVLDDIREASQQDPAALDRAFREGGGSGNSAREAARGGATAEEIMGNFGRRPDVQAVLSELERRGLSLDDIRAGQATLTERLGAGTAAEMEETVVFLRRQLELADVAPARITEGVPAAQWLEDIPHQAMVERQREVALRAGNEAFEADRSALRRNLEAADIPTPQVRWEAHHIIPWEFRDHPAILELRNSFGWNHNALQNAIPLPRSAGEAVGTAHRAGFDHAAYNWRVGSRLEELHAQFVRGGLDSQRLQAEVNALIASLRADIESGRLYRLM